MPQDNATALLSDPLRAEIKELVREAIQEAGSQNGYAVELLSAKTAAKRWDIPVSWIRDMARRGELPCVKLGHYTRFKPDDLARFIQEHRKEPAQLSDYKRTSIKKSA